MIERKNEERGNFLTFYDRGIKTCLKKKGCFLSLFSYIKTFTRTS